MAGVVAQRDVSFIITVPTVVVVEYDVKIFYCVFIVLTRVTSEDRCAPTSGCQPWSHRLIPNINFQQKRSLREPVHGASPVFLGSRWVVTAMVMFHESGQHGNYCRKDAAFDKGSRTIRSSFSVNCFQGSASHKLTLWAVPPVIVRINSCMTGITTI